MGRVSKPCANLETAIRAARRANDSKPSGTTRLVIRRRDGRYIHLPGEPTEDTTRVVEALGGSIYSVQTILRLE